MRHIYNITESAPDACVKELDAPAPRGGRGDATVDEAKLALRADAERDGDNAQHDPSGSHENDP